MKKIVRIVALLLVSAVASIAIWNYIFHVRSLAELNRLLDGKVQISSLEFSGQQRYTNVSSPVIADYFSNAIRQKSEISWGGLTFDLTIHTSSGRSIQTYFVYNDMYPSFSIGLLTESVGDMNYKVCPFPKPIPPEVNGLLKFLGDTNLYHHE